MILKLKSGEGHNWNFFECDNIHTKQGNFNDYDCSDMISFYAVNTNWDNNPKFNYFTLMKESKVIYEIKCNTYAYLMNNDGKTIEKLN